MRTFSLGRIAGAILTVSLTALPPSAALAASAPTMPHTAPATAPLDSVADATARVLELTNGERTKAGLAPLSSNPNLTQAAQSYAQVMADTSCVTHTCDSVTNFKDRAVAAGYTGWTALAENLAAGQATPEQIVASWMASPVHRANILNPSFTEIGVGIAQGGQQGMYWTQEFGARGSVVLSAGASPAPVNPVAPPAASVPPGAVVWTRGYPEIGPSGCVEYVAQWSDGTYSATPWECQPGTVARRGTLTATRGYPQLAADGCVEYVTQWSDGSYTWVPFSCPAGVTYIKR